MLWAQVSSLDDEDALAWFADQWWSKWVLLVVVLGACLFMMQALRTHGRRATKIERVAEGAGFHYQELDGPGIGRIRFQSFGPDGADVSNVVSATTADGTPVRAFDYQGVRLQADTRTRADDDPVRSVRLLQTADRAEQMQRVRVGALRTGAIARIDASLPQVTVFPERFTTRALDRLGAGDLETESGPFNRIFDVRTRDRAFAHRLLDARMIDFMLTSEGKMAFEVFGPWVLVSSDVAEPEHFPALVRLVAEFKRHVPETVLLDYPSAEEIDRRSGVD